MNRALPFRRMECLLDFAGSNSDKTCVAVSEIDNIRWTVRSRSSVVATGSLRDITRGLLQRHDSKIPGQFEAEKGWRYTVLLGILEDASELNSTNPRLIIQTFHQRAGRSGTKYVIKKERVN